MKIKFPVLLFCLLGVLMFCCESGDNNPIISSDHYKVADGFELEVAASEPLLEAPVAMDFDNRGRMWVVEMRGYMPNLAGTGEDKPNGRISILDPSDKDGRALHVKIFLDSLVLPRAIALVYGGVLYSAPPNLWFVEINNDLPGKKVLVDSIYSDEYSNPENQANGLMMNIDNWIYSAYSTSRYQLKDGKWIKEPTSFRGQYGMTKDNFGRLYYNYNELQLAGDYVLPNTVINNPYLKPTAAINKSLTDNQRVYPLHPTTVNRGYVDGILNKDSVLINFTAACGPVIYRGDQFPEEYSQNAFVCEPEANLIKRNVLSFASLETTAVQAWDDREFIASTDEGFRPVQLMNGPDGAMYIVDMHRGIMQHRVSATPYYRNGIALKELDTLLNAGRILRVKSKDKDLDEIPDLVHASAADLVTLLKSTNGWTRDRAQQLLISKQMTTATPALQKLALDQQNTVSAIHALYTLDGLNALSFELLKEVATSGSSMLSAHALVLLRKFNTTDHINAMKDLATDLLARKDTVVNLYLAMSLGPWAVLSKDTFLPMLVNLSRIYPDNEVYQEAVASSLAGLEGDFRVFLTKSNDNRGGDEIINNLLDQSIANKRAEKKNSIFVQRRIATSLLQKGLVIYRSTCAACHGADGEGIQHLAPPLNGSEYVSGPTARLAMIILNGLHGPIHVKGQLYNFNGIMQSFGDVYTDEEIAGIIDYLHNSFVAASPKLSYGLKSVKPDEITVLRNNKYGILTEEDLLEMADGRKQDAAD